MKRIPAIKRFMTPFPYTVDISVSVKEARSFLQEHAIRHLPVTENGKLAGVVSDRDLQELSYTGKQGDSASVKELKMKHPYVVDLNDRLDNVLYTMAENHIESALVTRNGKLAGVFTVTDACRGFADFLREKMKHDGGGEAA